jgi:ParB family chromosome partitioning protein
MEEKAGSVILCPVDKIRPNEDQPRQAFDEEKLKELAESIRANGVMQPILVRRLDGGYQIIAGERRWRAARMAGLLAVPAMVKEASGTRMLELALIENIQREDLNPLEEAEAYRQLVEEHGLTQEELSERVGRQRSTVANTLRLLKLPEEVRRMLLTGDLSMGHARALLSLGSAAEQLELARSIVSGKLSVRATENSVRAQAGAGARKEARSRRGSPAENRLKEELQRRLATKVEISSRRRGGKIVIHYYGLEDLDRLVNIIMGN